MSGQGLPVPVNFECSYNGYTFDPVYTMTTGLAVEPVSDSTGRTISHSVFTISLRTHIHGADTPKRVEEARRFLSKQGGILIYSGRAFGDLRINTSRVSDVNFGPKPGTFNATLQGPRESMMIEWSVTTSLPDCENAIYSLLPMELSYSVDFQLSITGRVSRTVRGEVRIANRRATPGSRKILDSPDKYREELVTPLAEGFRREWFPWVTDPTRTKMTFGWRDSEFENNVFPEGIVDAKASCTIRSSTRGLITYDVQLRAEYTLAADADSLAAEKAFAKLIGDRIAKIERTRTRGEKPSVVVTRFEVTEPDMYGVPRCDFSASFLVSNVTLQGIIAGSEIWKPFKADWKKWQTSLEASALHPRGYLRLTFTPGEDRIVDLCGSEKPSEATIAKKETKDSRGGEFTVVNADTSWLHYQNAVTIEADSGTIEHRPLPYRPIVPPAEPLGEVGLTSSSFGVYPPPTPTIDGVSEFSTSAPTSFTPSPNQPRPGGIGQTAQAVSELLGAYDSGFGPVAGGRYNAKDKRPEQTTSVQRRAAPACTVIMYGEAVRAGYPISCPALTDVEGVTPIAANRPDAGEGFTTSIVGNSGVPIYAAKWRLRYYLEKIPAGPIANPPNPLYSPR